MKNIKLLLMLILSSCALHGMNAALRSASILPTGKRVNHAQLYNLYQQRVRYLSDDTKNLSNEQQDNSDLFPARGNLAPLGCLVAAPVGFLGGYLAAEYGYFSNIETILATTGITMVCGISMVTFFAIRGRTAEQKARAMLQSSGWKALIESKAWEKLLSHVDIKKYRQFLLSEYFKVDWNGNIETSSKDINMAERKKLIAKIFNTIPFKD